MTTMLDAVDLETQTWVDVCHVQDLLPERGVRALVGAAHVAVFRTHDGEVHALDDIDPFSGASVL